MFSPFAVLLLALAVAELFVLVQVASMVGSLQAVLLVFAVSMIALVAVRSMWGRLFGGAVQRLRGGSSDPTAEILDNVLMLLGVALLILPGFVTAAIGLALLVPSIRHLAHPMIRSRFRTVTSVGQQFDRRFGRGVVIDTDLASRKRDSDANSSTHDARPELR